MERLISIARAGNKPGPHSVIVSMMLAKSRWFGVCIVSVALLIAGCSRGGPASSAAKRGPCPNPYPAVSRQFSLKTVNEGVQGLGARLVPFPAEEVRVCSYDSRGGSLKGTAVLKQAAATHFEASTNRLRTRTNQPTRPFTCHQFDTSLLTFTTTTKGMAVAVAECGGGVASNGTLTVDSTRTWLDQLAALTMNQPKSG